MGPDSRPPTDQWGHKAPPARVQWIAENAWLKVVQYVVTLVAVPLIAWAGGAVLDRLSAIEKSIHQFSTTTATTELRLQSLERERVAHEQAIDSVRQTQSEIRYRLQRIEDRAESRR